MGNKELMEALKEIVRKLHVYNSKNAVEARKIAQELLKELENNG